MLKIKRDINIWFCSDPHYNHKNLCRGVSSWDKSNYTRDFKSLDHMNQNLIDGINKNVKQNDILFCLGDWSFGGIDKIWKFRSQINCQKIHLILGNHDHHIENRELIPSESNLSKPCEEIFESINHYLQVEIDGSKFVLSHYPMASWNGLKKGWMHLFGHCHLLPHQRIREGKSMDIGFDGHPEFRPYHLDEILFLLKNQPISGITISKDIDHHQINR